MSSIELWKKSILLGEGTMVHLRDGRRHHLARRRINSHKIPMVLTTIALQTSSVYRPVRCSLWSNLGHHQIPNLSPHRHPLSATITHDVLVRRPSPIRDITLSIRGIVVVVVAAYPEGHYQLRLHPRPRLRHLTGRSGKGTVRTLVFLHPNALSGIPAKMKMYLFYRAITI